METGIVHAKIQQASDSLRRRGSVVGHILDQRQCLLSTLNRGPTLLSPPVNSHATKAGADVDAARHDDGATPLSVAAQKGRSEVVQLPLGRFIWVRSFQLSW